MPYPIIKAAPNKGMQAWRTASAALPLPAAPDAWRYASKIPGGTVMAEGKVVFVTEWSDELNDQVIRSTPAGLTAMMVPNRVSDDEKIAALTDADFLLSYGGTFSERVLRSACKRR